MSRTRFGVMPRRLMAAAFVAAILSAQVGAVENITVVINGIDEPMAANVRNHITKGWTLGNTMNSTRLRQAFLDRARKQSTSALKPWGYYRPDISTHLQQDDAGAGWNLTVDIEPGPPVLVEVADITVDGAGAALPKLQSWLAQWPLQPGARLDQTVWEREKDDALDTAHAGGFLKAGFTRHRIALDLERNTAVLELHLETGERALMGQVEFDQDIVQPYVLEPLPRFQPGDPYNAELVDLLRLDLWKTGYFGDIEVIEQRAFEQDPPVVNFQVNLGPRKRSTHQVTLGYGTDTRVRTQYNWTRHLLSDRGDSFSIAGAWRQEGSEILASAEYRLPRRTDTYQHWLVNSVLRRENQEFIIRDDNDREILQIAEGQVLDAQLKLGRWRLRETPWSSKRIQETVFAEFLRERDSLRQSIAGNPLEPEMDLVDQLFGQTSFSLAIGMEWDWPVIRGSGFTTAGHHERAWWFTSNQAWGSEKDFSQVYLSSRWNHMLGARWKLLLRGEIGYSDARVSELDLESAGVDARISVTELPYRYSFRTGGSQAVRGYRYNDLSDNGIGANHLLVASAELEYRVLENWSVAAFVDQGNAFNRWSDKNLKTGWGGGIRWYSPIGAVRLDFGRAEDLEGKPWEFYLTIGTPLL